MMCYLIAMAFDFAELDPKGKTVEGVFNLAQDISVGLHSISGESDRTALVMFNSLYEAGGVDVDDRENLGKMRQVEHGFGSFLEI